jgi:hypothetical protein
MHKIISVLLVFVFLTSFQQPQSDKRTIIDRNVKGTIDSALKSFVDAGKIAGVSALIFEKNKEVYYNAFGLPIRKKACQWLVILLFASIP